MIAGKNVLVTGGCGSIGSTLVERLLEQNPRSVRVLDNDEQRLFALEQRLYSEDSVRFLLGSIRDRDRLELAMEDVDVVFHAAANKHVEINEYNPYEAVQTNVQGTQNVIWAAIQEDVDSFVGISTDKASNPTSVMGATKLLAERLIVAANTDSGTRNSRFSCVRFGNVLASSGSVVPVFLQQIREGGPMTVTDPAMTRFLMPMNRAVEFILEAQERMDRGEVFVSKMPAFRVGDLAEALRQAYAPEFGRDPSSIDVEIVGKRPGERTHEKLLSPEEAENTYELEDMFVLVPEIEDRYDEFGYTEAAAPDREYTSADANLLSHTELVEMVRESTVGSRRELCPNP